MVPYLLVLLLIPILNLVINPAQNRNRRIIFSVGIFGLLTLLAAVRKYTVGIDTKQYTDSYMLIGKDADFSFSNYRYEYGFTLLCRFLNYISPEPQLLILVTSVFIFSVVGYTIYRFSDDVALSAFLFVSMTTYTLYLNAMRQAIAVAFMLLAYCMFRDDKKVFSLFFIIVATQFHKSAWLVLLVLPAIFSPFTNLTLFIYIVIIFGMFLGANYVTSVIAQILGREQFYDADHMAANYFGPVIQLIFIICIVIVYFFYTTSQRVNKDKILLRENYFFRHILMLWIMFAAMGIRIEVMSRFSYYFAPFVLFALPFALSKASRKESFAAKFLLCTVCLLYFLIIGLLRPEWHGAIPYVADFLSVHNIFGTFFSDWRF